MSTKLNITGLKDSAEAIAPADNGTYAHIGSKGGTEQMYDRLMDSLPQELKDEFNIICSRVRVVDSSKRNILWLHDTWDDPESQHLKKQESLDRFEKLIFVSNYQQCTYNMGLSVPYSKGLVLQNAIEPIEQHEKPTGTVNLIYHTTPHRGLELLVPVMEFLANNEAIDFHLDVYSSFKIYGWEQRDEPYLKLFEKIQQHPNMTYHGYQPNHVIREALKKAHIYAYPNIWPETSGISVIEAMSAGCSVVCPNFAALPETCSNFAAMYNWHENANSHARIFAGTLLETMRRHQQNESSLNQTLKVQKIYFDNFYNWDIRKIQWIQYLTALKEGKVMS